MKPALSLLTLLAAGLFAGSSMAMTDQEYKAERDRIAADYKAAKAQCDALKGNAEDVCEEQAKGAEKVAGAELEAKRNPSDGTQRNVELAKANAEYGVAKEKCDDLSGEAKITCRKDASAAHKAARDRMTASTPLPSR
ncbi:hypothetical protein [Ottowia sp.]|jgi:hypothetical protein|uniref:hypothetical protein n=1 Tax=Ottowia sp. TaxID=1898956 RepID=UPI0025EB1746|nr:hypothetical protein [Ottowia sp.]MBK6613209.1 hypothetical protein [Ottowia sp.]MBK6747682.1 hypothetical protein [Ottowia sp.]